MYKIVKFTTPLGRVAGRIAALVRDLKYMTSWQNPSSKV